MRAVIERGPLLAAMIRLMGVVERRSTIEILANIVLTVTPGKVTLRGTDLDMEAIEEISAATDEPGAITLPADKFHDIVRNADEGAQITVSMDRKSPRAKVVCGRANFSVPTLPADDFPKFPAESLSEPWAMPAKTLADMMARVAFCRGEAKVVSALSATYLTVLDGEVHCVAANRSGIAFRREVAPEGAAISAMLLPKFTSQLVRWLADADGDALISSSPSLVRVVCGGATITGKVIDGTYVDYRRVLIEAHDIGARTDQDGMATAIRRAMIMADDQVRSVRLAFSDGGIQVSTRAQSGEGADEVPCEYAGPDVDFLMTATDLQAALANLRGDVLEMSFAPTFEPSVSKSAQVIIRAPSDPGMVVNLMQPRA